MNFLLKYGLAASLNNQRINLIDFVDYQINDIYFFLTDALNSYNKEKNTTHSLEDFLRESLSEVFEKAGYRLSSVDSLTGNRKFHFEEYSVIEGKNKKDFIKCNFAFGNHFSLVYKKKITVFKEEKQIFNYLFDTKKQNWWSKEVTVRTLDFAHLSSDSGRTPRTINKMKALDLFLIIIATNTFYRPFIELDGTVYSLYPDSDLKNIIKFVKYFREYVNDAGLNNEKVGGKGEFSMPYCDNSNFTVNSSKFKSHLNYDKCLSAVPELLLYSLSEGVTINSALYDIEVTNLNYFILSSSKEIGKIPFYRYSMPEHIKKLRIYDYYYDFLKIAIEFAQESETYSLSLAAFNLIEKWSDHSFFKFRSIFVSYLISRRSEIIELLGEKKPSIDEDEKLKKENNILKTFRNITYHFIMSKHPKTPFDSFIELSKLLDYRAFLQAKEIVKNDENKVQQEKEKILYKQLCNLRSFVESNNFRRKNKPLIYATKEFYRIFELNLDSASSGQIQSKILEIQEYIENNNLTIEDYIDLISVFSMKQNFKTFNNNQTND